jgi:ABC-type transport system involved in multi-copper enzyme maturation permease subunit
MITVPATSSDAGPVTARRLVRSEWTKFRSLRSSWWTIATSTVLMAGVGVAIAAAAAAEKKYSAVPADIASRGGIGCIFAQLVLGTLAVLLVSGEYGTGMIRSSMTAVPKRLPVLWAKLAVYIAVVFPVTLATSLATFLLGQVVWQAHGRPSTSLGADGVARILIGAPMYLTVAGVCAIAIATLLRSTAAAITAMVGLFFVLPTVWGAMPESIAGIGRVLPSNAGAALPRLATTAHPLPPWTGFGLLCGYAIVLLGLAAWRLRRADV